jgi:hypothetical protein
MLYRYGYAKCILSSILPLVRGVMPGSGVRWVGWGKAAEEVWKVEVVGRRRTRRGESVGAGGEERMGMSG